MSKILRLDFSTQYNFLKSHPKMLTISITCSFLLLISTPWNGYKNVSLFIYPLKNIWVISGSWQLWMKLLQILVYRFLFEHEFLCLFVSGKMPRSIFAGSYGICMFSLKKKTTARVAVPFSIPTSRRVPVFHILTSNFFLT